MTLDEIRELIEAATPGPWREGTKNVWRDETITCIAQCQGPSRLREDRIAHGLSPAEQRHGELTGSEAQANCRFISAARTLLPALLAAVEDMADELQAAKDGDSYVCKAESVDRMIAALEALKLP